MSVYSSGTLPKMSFAPMKEEASRYRMYRYWYRIQMWWTVGPKGVIEGERNRDKLRSLTRQLVG
jgi:hypothetical protein